MDREMRNEEFEMTLCALTGDSCVEDAMLVIEESHVERLWDKAVAFGEKKAQAQIAQLQAELKQEQLMRFHSDATVNAAQEHIGKLQAERDELKQRGRAMSNVLFNLKQRAGYTLTDSDREKMERLQEAWDLAFLGATGSEGEGNG